MRLTTPFTVLRNATSDIWGMHDFNYQLPKDQRQDYWEKECIDHPTSCLLYTSPSPRDKTVSRMPSSA